VTGWCCAPPLDGGGCDAGPAGHASGPLIASLSNPYGQIEIGIAPGQGTAGYWYTFGDGTGSMIPAPGGPFARTPAVPPCPLPFSYAACMSSVTPFSNYGAGMGFNFVTSGVNMSGGASQPSAYDVSAYRGIQFYARAADLGPWSQWVSVQFPDVHTDSAYPGAACIGSDAGACDENAQSTITLTSDWQLYEVDFATLTQGLGAYPENGLDLAGALGIQFAVFGGVALTAVPDAGVDPSMPPSVSFNVCVADITFVPK
jgi:hypothetical protein